MEKEDALAAQWEECQRLQQEAVEAACSALRRQLRHEFNIEKEQAVAAALKEARVSEDDDDDEALLFVNVDDHNGDADGGGDSGAEEGSCGCLYVHVVDMIMMVVMVADAKAVR